VVEVVEVDHHNKEVSDSMHLIRMSNSRILRKISRKMKKGKTKMTMGATIGTNLLLITGLRTLKVIKKSNFLRLLLPPEMGSIDFMHTAMVLLKREWLMLINKGLNKS
jgi:hypothetical protein